MIPVDFDTSSMADYHRFLKVRQLPHYQWRGRRALIPDEYAEHLDLRSSAAVGSDYVPLPSLFDYQRDISAMAIRKRKFAVFAECGLGKSLIILEFARHTIKAGRKTLIVTPLMVVPQFMSEVERFYGITLPVEQLRASELQAWLNSDRTDIGMTNFEAIRGGLEPGNLGALIIDESSMLKSHYGRWGTRLIQLGKGLDYKLCATGTPAPNDRIEFANHAVFLDRFRSPNEFLARYFVNRGQTDNRWEIRPHAVGPFYRGLSDWCIFLTDPSVFGWSDNTDTIPPIHVHIETVPLTAEQRKACQSLTGSLIVKDAGGITQRSKLSQIAKGTTNVPSNKPQYIRDLIASWPSESTIIWCHYNREQDQLDATFPDACSIRGDTPYTDRLRQINDFKAGRNRVMISKPSVLGFGLNLQVATRQVFNGMRDSYEEFHQAVKRSNRIGSTKPLNVHIPILEIEEPMVQSVLRKAHRIDEDTAIQQKLFANERMN